MKKIFFSLILISWTVFSTSCGEKKTDPVPQKTPEELAIEDLTGGTSQTWTVSGGGSVQRDGRSETNIYQNFEITFSANNSSKTYQTFNNNSLFAANGNWEFVSGRVDRIRLSGTAPASGQEISFNRTGNDLRLQFNIPVPNARIEAVAGGYVFNLRRRQ
ncbi:hypothetical protein [Cecembia rubra]|uniref:Lipocalin-like protein n=1 Tax=Cecembia rubra TaxID=1485585 RepID=A0A2P8E9S1_9BACT|nr:hypothetical protein [Cecembia rubra]PSL06226.1 hypothetical protein CLV48_10240 [Cecembia rubra]